MTQIFYIVSFLLLFLFSVFQVKSQELCQSYTAYGEFHPEQSCTSYCCGDCGDRYCCYDYSYRLDQTKCSAENCTGYYDSYGYYESAVDCYGSFCCGSCDFRYCCWYPSDRLNQKKCPSGLQTTTKQHYPDYNDDSFYWIIIACICFSMCICLVAICRFCFKKRRMRQSTNNYTRIDRNYIRHQYPIIQPPPNNITNNTGVYEPIGGQSYPRPVASNNPDFNKNYNTYASDDLPPSYDTIVAKQTKTEETVAENS